SSKNLECLGRRRCLNHTKPFAFQQFGEERPGKWFIIHEKDRFSAGGSRGRSFASPLHTSGRGDGFSVDPFYVMRDLSRLHEMPHHDVERFGGSVVVGM